MESRRGRSKWRNITLSDALGRIGLQQFDGDVKRSDSVMGQSNQQKVGMERRAAHTATKTLLDVIVQNPEGQIIGQTTLDSIPTADATISFPFGQITIESSITPSETSVPTYTAVPPPSTTPSLSIQLPGSSSQQVLASSSPPPTPNPSSISSPSRSSSQLPSSSTRSPNTSSPPAASTSPPARPTFSASNSTTIRTSSAASTKPSISTTLGRNSTTISPSSTFSASGSSTGFRSSSIFSSSTRTSLSTFSTSTLPSTSSSSTSTFLSSTSLESSASSTGLIPSPTENGAGGGAAPTGTGAAPAASTTAAASGGGTVNVPVVGGVVGGLAGFALLLALLLFFLRWRRRKIAGSRQLPSRAEGDAEAARPDTGISSGQMTQTPSSGWGAAGIAPLFKKMRPHSQATTETAPSERGFQKISGRKLESVLLSGGDGYGATGPSRPQERNMSGSSFYRDSQGTYGGPAASAGTSMNVGPASARQSGAPSSNYEAPGSPPPEMPERALSSSPSDTMSSSPPEAVIMRPGPARQPVHQPGFSNVRPGGPPPPGLSPVPSRIRQDGIGRSHPSMDGSRDSRGSRFAEDFN